jgi:hypothetical protein
MMKLAAPLTGAVGNRVVVYFEHLGKFEGHIIQIQQRTLTMKVFGTNEDRLKIARRLAWITDAKKPQERRYPRMVPANPASIVSLSGQPAVPCEVIDYSVGGVAVYADFNPPIGSAVKIGKVLSRVVRHFGGGFAVCFLPMQNPELVEASILQPATQCEER